MGTNLGTKVEELLSLDAPPSVPHVPMADEHSALHAAVSAANHWFQAYKVAQADLIRIEDARDILERGGRARRNYLLARMAAVIFATADVVMAIYIGLHG